MPRGKKKKVVVLFSPDGHILGHKYHNNHRNVDKAKAFLKKYDPKTRTRVAPAKIKDEKHSS